MLNISNTKPRIVWFQSRKYFYALKLVSALLLQYRFN